MRELIEYGAYALTLAAMAAFGLAVWAWHFGRENPGCGCCTGEGAS